MTKTITAAELAPEHITNLVSVQHTVYFGDEANASTAITTGQLLSITQGAKNVALGVGGVSFVVNPDTDVMIHSTHTQMHAPETIEAVKSAFPEEKK